MDNYILFSKYFILILTREHRPPLP